MNKDSTTFRACILICNSYKDSGVKMVITSDISYVLINPFRFDVGVDILIQSLFSVFLWWSLQNLLLIFEAGKLQQRCKPDS